MSLFHGLSAFFPQPQIQKIPASKRISVCALLPSWSSWFPTKPKYRFCLFPDRLPLRNLETVGAGIVCFVFLICSQFRASLSLKSTWVLPPSEPPGDAPLGAGCHGLLLRPCCPDHRELDQILVSEPEGSLEKELCST